MCCPQLIHLINTSDDSELSYIPVYLMQLLKFFMFLLLLQKSVNAISHRHYVGHL